MFTGEYVRSTHADKIKKSQVKHQATPSRQDINGSDNKEDKSPDGLPDLLCSHKAIKILAYCDQSGNLVELKFDKNKHISCLIFKIMALIIKYQVFLTRITIYSGMDKHTLYEMKKFLASTNITELNLDNSVFSEANYDILFEDESKIRYLSLARCKINDEVVENIAKKLAYPLPASKVLTCLILSSNRISDKGAQCLADALRSNRHLRYISLAGNSITDSGASYILDSLAEFALNEEEIIDGRSRYMDYLKQKNAIINNIIKELRSGEYDKKIKKKAARPISSLPVKKGKLEKEGSLKSVSESKSSPNLDYLFFDRATSMAEDRMGEFTDPFSSQNTSVRDGTVYCLGNNALCCLSLAYNNLSFLILKKLSSVLMYQKLCDRRPRGLVKVCVEGNNLPVACKELGQIDDALEAARMSSDRRTSTSKRKPVSRINTPR